MGKKEPLERQKDPRELWDLLCLYQQLLEHSNYLCSIRYKERTNSLQGFEVRRLIEL